MIIPAFTIGMAKYVMRSWSKFMATIGTLPMVTKEAQTNITLCAKLMKQGGNLSMNVPPGYKVAFVKRKPLSVAFLWDIIGVTGEYPDAWVCGGFARESLSSVSRGMPGDIDIYCKNEYTFDGVKRLLDGGLQVQCETEKAITFTNSTIPIQLIKFPMGPVETILETFDFSITMAAMLASTGGIIFNELEDDDKNNMLRVKNISNPLHTWLRATKYISKGYYLPPSEIVKILIDWEGRSSEFKRENINKFKDITTAMDIDSQGRIKNIDTISPY